MTGRKVATFDPLNIYSGRYSGKHRAWGYKGLVCRRISDYVSLIGFLRAEKRVENVYIDHYITLRYLLREI